MVGYVCKIVFSSLFWVLFDFEFVSWLGGLCWLLGLCDCKLGVGFGAGFVCFLVGGYLFGYLEGSFKVLRLIGVNRVPVSRPRDEDRNVSLLGTFIMSHPNHLVC